MYDLEIDITNLYLEGVCMTCLYGVFSRLESPDLVWRTFFWSFLDQRTSSGALVYLLDSEILFESGKSEATLLSLNGKGWN
jgi:hypothetical protein